MLQGQSLPQMTGQPLSEQENTDITLGANLFHKHLHGTEASWGGGISRSLSVPSTPLGLTKSKAQLSGLAPSSSTPPSVTTC